MTRFLSLALPLALALAACDDDDHGVDDPCGEPAYGGAATDEAWESILDQYDTAEVGAVEAVTLTTPAADATLAAGGGPPTFAWTSPIAQGMQRPLATPRAAPTHDQGWLEGALAALGDFFVGSAHAHLPPITGDLYYIEVKIPGRECAVRALTTEESWVPSAADWAILQASAGATLELVITSAYLKENRISEGPYRTTLSFKVQ